MKRALLLATLILAWGYQASAACMTDYECETEWRLHRLESQAAARAEEQRWQEHRERGAAINRQLERDLAESQRRMDEAVSRRQEWDRY